MNETNEKLNRISERVYNASFILVALIVLGATIGTSTVRYITGNEINLISKDVFEFIKDVILYFTIPVTVKIIGDKLPDMISLLYAIRGIQVENKNILSVKTEEEEING